MRVVSAVVLFALVFVTFNTLFSFYLIEKTEQELYGLSSSSFFTAHALSEQAYVQLCINHLPTLTYPCSTSWTQNTPVSCYLNGDDFDNDTLFYYTNNSLFNVSLYTGHINFTPNQSAVGNHTILFYVHDDACSNINVTLSVNFTVADVNDPPVLLTNITDLSILDGETQYPWDLDLYFMDPDGDLINYSVINATGVIRIQIDNVTHLVTAIANIGAIGEYYIYFNATDEHGLSTISNPVKITIRDRISPPEQSYSSGGGSSSSFSCISDWRCQGWSACNENNTQTRLCVDLNLCAFKTNQPETERECNVYPTCYDGIRNGNEEGIDCGGDCPACGTCYDGIQNNGEAGIDCGGSCLNVCSSCTDGIQNGDETGIDCGGSCPNICFSCDDGIKNGDEKGVDCGGSCPKACFVLPELIKKNELLTFKDIMLILLVLAAIIGTIVYASKYLSKYLSKYFAVLPVAKSKKDLVDQLLHLDHLIVSKNVKEAVITLRHVTLLAFKFVLGLEGQQTFDEIAKKLRVTKVGTSDREHIREFSKQYAEQILDEKKDVTLDQVKVVRFGLFNSLLSLLSKNQADTLAIDGQSVSKHKLCYYLHSKCITHHIETKDYSKALKGINELDSIYYLLDEKDKNKFASINNKFKAFAEKH